MMNVLLTIEEMAMQLRADIVANDATNAIVACIIVVMIAIWMTGHEKETR